MYKQDTCFMFKNSTGWSVAFWNDFEFEFEYNTWMSDRLSEGLVYIREESKKVDDYPQILRLDFKYNLGGYSSIIERFSSSKEYKTYCDFKLSQGYKVIGSEPYNLN